jgi:hypothetical protein
MTPQHFPLARLLEERKPRVIHLPLHTMVFFRAMLARLARYPSMRHRPVRTPYGMFPVTSARG